MYDFDESNPIVYFKFVAASHFYKLDLDFSNISDSSIYIANGLEIEDWLFRKTTLCSPKFSVFHFPSNGCLSNFVGKSHRYYVTFHLASNIRMILWTGQAARLEPY